MISRVALMDWIEEVIPQNAGARGRCKSNEIDEVLFKCAGLHTFSMSASTNF